MNAFIKKIITSLMIVISCIQVSNGQCDATLADNSGNNFSTCNSYVNFPNFTLTVLNASSTTATNTSYTINWGDGTPDFTTNSNWPNTSHTYISLGVFTLTFTVTGPNGCSDTQTYTVFNGATDSTPGLDFGEDNSNPGCVPDNHTFNISNFQNNLPNTIYVLSINDGSNDVTFSHPPPTQYTHTFTTPSCDTIGNGSSSFYSATIEAISACALYIGTDSVIGVKTIILSPIIIEKPPIADFEIAPDDVICASVDVITFTSTSTPGSYVDVGCKSDIIYEWTISPNSGYSLTSGTLLTDPEISATFSTPGNYDVTLTVRNGDYSCGTDMITKQVCVLPQPSANYSYSTNQNCPSVIATFANQSNTLNSCDATDYSWDVTFGGSECGTNGTWQFINNTSITSQSPTIRFDSTGVYLIALSVSNICGTDIYLDSVIVGSPPILNIAPIGNLCLSGSIQPELDVTLSCNADVNSPYVWSFPNGSPSSFNGESPPMISYSSPGNYTISVSVNNECGATTATQSFTIHPLPTIPNIIPNEPCDGQDLCFTVQGGNNLEYSWSGPGGWTSTDQNACVLEATPTASGTYFLTVTDTSTDCENTTTINATVNPLPNVGVNGNLSICIGNSTMLTATGANTYAWSPSTGLNTTSGAMVVASPATTTTYTVTGIDGNGCVNIFEVEVVVNDLPIVDAGENQTACQNQNLTLNGTPAGPGGFWTGPHVSNSGIFNSPDLGVFTVTYHFADGVTCVDSSTVDICVVHNPESDFSIDEEIGCLPLAVAATNMSNTIGDCEAASYTWFVNFNGSPCHSNTGNWTFTQGGVNSQNAIFSFTESGEYEINLEVDNACGIVTSTKTITVMEAPQVEIAEIGDVCDNLALTATATINSCLDTNPLTYNWTFTGGSPTSSNMEFPNEITYNTVGNYTVSLSVTNQCGTTTDTEGFEIFTLPTAVVSNNGVLCAGETLNLSTNLPGSLNFNWQGPNSFSSTDPNPSILNTTVAASGTYFVTISDGNTCTRIGDTEVIINPLPNVAVSATATEICIGESVTITASGAIDYIWSPAGSLNTSIGNVVIATPTTTTIYTVTGTDANGCLLYTSDAADE